MYHASHVGNEVAPLQSLHIAAHAVGSSTRQSQ